MANKKSWFRSLNILLGGLFTLLTFSSCKIRIFPPANLYGVPYEVYEKEQAKIKSDNTNPEDSTQVSAPEAKDAKKEDPQ